MTMQGALTCIETKVLRIERNILQRIPPNTCKGVYGRGHLHPPRVQDDVQLRDAALKMAKDDSQVRDDRETSSSHLLMPRFMKYLKHPASPARPAGPPRPSCESARSSRGSRSARHRIHRSMARHSSTRSRRDFGPRSTSESSIGIESAASSILRQRWRSVSKATFPSRRASDAPRQ